MTVAETRAPRDNLSRVVLPGIELRAAEEEGRGPIMFGHFARFDEWTEIDSWMEGNFMERFAPGAFKKTLRERTPKVLFQHGRDGELSNRPIGEVLEVREDDEGVYYEVELFDSLPDLLVEGLRAGVYGASFRFNVMREDRVKDPRASDYNPKGLPERTVKEVQVAEFGPVTFPAYDGATAGVRSLTDEFFIQRLADQPERLRRLLDWLDQDAPDEGRDQEVPDSEERGDAPDEEAREQETPPDAETDGQEAETHLEREQDDQDTGVDETRDKTAPPEETPETSTSPQGRREARSTRLVLPRAPRPRKRGGVLPNPDAEEKEGWRQIRLP